MNDNVATPSEACNLTRFKLLSPPTSLTSSSLRAMRFLQAEKRHTIGLVAGTGPSVGRLTADQSRVLQASMDIWGMNQFFLHKDLGVCLPESTCPGMPS